MVLRGRGDETSCARRKVVKCRDGSLNISNINKARAGEIEIIKHQMRSHPPQADCLTLGRLAGSEIGRANGSQDAI